MTNFTEYIDIGLGNTLIETIDYLGDKLKLGIDNKTADVKRRNWSRMGSIQKTQSNRQKQNE